jgi:hypothetical protein
MPTNKRLVAAEFACSEAMDFLLSLPIEEDQIIDVPPHRLRRVAKAILDWGVLSKQWTASEVRAARKQFKL